MIQAMLSSINRPLVGLEFLIYIDDADDNSSNNFICTLCSKQGNFANMIQHVESSPHCLKFLRTVLPKVADALNLQIFLNARDEKSKFFDIVKIEIELLFGRKASFTLPLNLSALSHPLNHQIPSIVKVTKPENKWKLCLSHFNHALLNRVRTSSKINKNLITKIQKKRKALKKLDRKERKASCRERSRSPLKELKEGHEERHRDR